MQWWLARAGTWHVMWEPPVRWPLLSNEWRYGSVMSTRRPQGTVL